jgi:hypothetical protein
MSKKIEKLKEINAQLDNVLTKLETHIFINNIDNVQDKKIKKEAPDVILEQK